MHLGAPQERLQTNLDEIVVLLQKHRVLETFTHRQETTRKDLLERLQRQQNLVELQGRCKRLHPADLAFILESLPAEDRLLVWSQISIDAKGQVLLELADAVRDWLLEHTEYGEQIDALGRLPADDSVGHAMAPDVMIVRESQTAGEALAELARPPQLSRNLGFVGVVDARNTLRGILWLSDLVRQAPQTPVNEIMDTDPIVFAIDDPLENAVRAFERYNLVAAPVVTERGKLVGRITPDVVIDYIRSSADRAALQSAGLGREEDLFAPVLDSARNRWPWLMINLLTAFFASRVIGVFEHTIGQLVALATLMPIVASIGGNTGNQTVALVIRGLALDQLQAGAFGHLVRKELTVSLLNGLLWGTVMGLCAFAMYRSMALGLVMMAAMLMNLIVAALVGVTVPIGLQRVGRDPAQGASVLLTFVTDSMGFFLFLGLARVFLL